MKMGEDTVAGVQKLISVTALWLSKFAICSHSCIGFFTGIAFITKFPKLWFGNVDSRSDDRLDQA
jgi:hypothetical protein